MLIGLQIEIIFYVLPPAALIFSLPWAISLILAWFYWYMERTQFFFLPMAGSLQPMNDSP